MNPNLKSPHHIETDPNGKRVYPRVEFSTQAFVTIPPLKTRVFQVREISRGGMFLSFKDASSTLTEIENEGIAKGSSMDIDFSVILGREKHRVNVRAKIARITRKGLGVEFNTHNPPQLASLRDFFPSAFSRNDKVSDKVKVTPSRGPQEMFRKLAQSSDWKEWELEEN